MRVTLIHNEGNPHCNPLQYTTWKQYTEDMAFFRKIQQKINGLWYPQAVTVGKPATTDEVARRLSQMSTVSRADLYAALMDIGIVLGDIMAQGRSVKLEGLGTFYYTAVTNGKGVPTAEEVSAKTNHGRTRALHPRGETRVEPEDIFPLARERRHLLGRMV